MNELQARLITLSDEKYREFASALIPDCNNMLGVRLPVLRKIAKEIYKNDWETFLSCRTKYFEETMLQAMVISLAAKEQCHIKLVENFIPKINNWSVCDSFCCGLKFTLKYPNEIFEFLQKYLNSQKEFEIRFAHVMLLNYFVEDKYLEYIFDTLNKFKSDKYYAQMSAAWLISICFIKYPQKTFEFLKNTPLDKFIFNKAIQKIIDSHQIDTKTKNKLRQMKR